MVKKSFVRRHVGIFYVLPAILVVAGIMFFPLFYTIVLSFFKQNVFTQKMTFVGFDQYIKLFSDPIFYKVTKNTTLWTVGSVLFQSLIGFSLAMIVHKINKNLQTIVRILLVVPWVIPGIAAVLVWQWSYHTDYGIINEFLKQLGLIGTSISWLGNTKTSLISSIIVNVWKMTPLVMLLIEAALQNVPAELKEAARVDGATRIKVFSVVTMPHLAPILKTTVLLLTIWTLNAFTYIYILTTGGPNYSSEILSLYIYRKAFQDFNYSYASAASVALFLLTAIFSTIYIRFTLKGGNYDQE